MNTGKTLFAQLMDFLPWTTFTRIVDRYWRRSPGPDAFLRRAIPVHGLRPADLPGKPERHRDLPLGPRIETLSHGLPPAGPALDAGRCQRKARLAYPCGVWPSGSSPRRGRCTSDEELGLDLTNTVYALDSTTIALCLSVFPWAHFRTTKAAVKMHTLLDLRGNISEFYPHLGWQAARRSCPRYALAGSRSHLRRGSWLRRLCPPLCVAPSRGLLRPRVPSRTSMLIASIRRRRIARPASFATRPSPWTASTPVRITPNFCGASASRTPSPARRWSSSPTTSRFPAATICALYKSRWQVELFFKWIKQHLRIKQFYGTSENAVKTQIWIAVSVYVLVAIVKKRLDLDASLYTLLQILSVTLFEKMPIHQALAGDENRCNASQITNQLNLFDF